MIKYSFVLFFYFILVQNLFPQSGKVIGFAFGDYFYKVNGDSSGEVNQYAQYSKGFNSFEFRRIAAGYDYFLFPIIPQQTNRTLC